MGYCHPNNMVEAEMNGIEVSEIREAINEIEEINFERRFWRLFQSEELSDVTIIIGMGEQKERIKSHKVVLAAASIYLKKYFSDRPTENELSIPIVKSDVFLPFLKFVYTGQDDFEVKDLIPVLHLARILQVPELVAVCENNLKTALTEQTAILIFKQAIEYEEKELEETARKKICQFAHKIMESDEFLELCEEYLLEFIGDDDLTVKNEIQVFNAVIRWAKAKCTRQSVAITSKSCRSYLEKLIPLIRFPQMDEGQFALKVAHGELKILTQEELLSLYFFLKIPIQQRSEASHELFNSKPRRYLDNITLTIHVKPSIGNGVTLEMKPLDTIASIKDKIRRDIGVPSDCHNLTFGGEVLQDEQTLLDLNILNETTLQSVNVPIPNPNPKQRLKNPRFLVQVQSEKCGIITPEIRPSMLVSNLKIDIQLITGIETSRQRLLYSGIELENQHPFSIYNVQDGAIFQLVVD